MFIIICIGGVYLGRVLVKNDVYEKIMVYNLYKGEEVYLIWVIICVFVCFFVFL